MQPQESTSFQVHWIFPGPQLTDVGIGLEVWEIWKNALTIPILQIYVVSKLFIQDLSIPTTRAIGGPSSLNAKPEEKLLPLPAQGPWWEARAVYGIMEKRRGWQNPNWASGFKALKNCSLIFQTGLANHLHRLSNMKSTWLEDRIISRYPSPIWL